MRYVSAYEIVKAVKDAVIKANIELSDTMKSLFKSALEREDSEIGKEVLLTLIKNAEIAYKEKIPMCQDTGIVTIFVEIGHEVTIKDGLLFDALSEGVRRGYKEGYLRMSVCDPLTRKNTMDNTPPIVHIEMVPGDRFTLWVFPKGGGAENKSRLYMLLPTDGWDEIKKKVI
ncbi:MAG: fumarate hydratase, partial [Candidatus Aenigmatarchaeota archaeon]